MFIYQLTIDKKYHLFVFSLLPVALFLCLLCVGSERGLAVYLVGSGLAPLLPLCSLFSYSPRCIALLPGLGYLSLLLMILLVLSTWDLGNLQKRCLKSIYSYEKSYDELLKESGLKLLEERREIALLKFARKTSLNPQFSNWFPRNQNRQSKRNFKPFKEEQARSEQFYKYLLYTMMKLLTERLTQSTNLTPDICPLPNGMNLD